jgi:hypothetical protein
MEKEVKSAVTITYDPIERTSTINRGEDYGIGNTISDNQTRIDINELQDIHLAIRITGEKLQSAEFHALHQKALQLVQRLKETFQANDELRSLVRRLRTQISTLETRQRSNETSATIRRTSSLRQSADYQTTTANGNRQFAVDWRNLPTIWTFLILTTLINLMAMYIIVTSE